ncbi:AIP3-domain-containing protein [Auricularia subglabra TFB-10046 SS5]|nr:AIP3-domain-containing protein [Auricularia subglabra TFB-10046 SS5]
MATQSPVVGSQRSSHRSSDRRGGSSRSGSSSHAPAVESAVTRLLVAIKQLLEALTLWSTLKMTENQVSDVYVRLGNDFNAAVAAFGAYGIDMSELLSVPDDLRGVLEQCLGEEANPTNLDQYLPTVRQIITNLLQGLRSKQSIYRRTVADKEPGGSDRHSTRSSRATADSIDRNSSLESRSARSGSSRRAQAMSSHSQTASEDGRFVGGFAPVLEEEQPASAVPRRTSAATSHSRGSPLSATADLEDTRSPRTPRSASRTLSEENAFIPPNPPPPVPQPHVPADVKRFSLSDNPVPPSPAPDVVVEAASPRTTVTNGRPPSRSGTASPPPPTPPIDQASSMQNSLAAQSSLAALKRSEALERRASKRFSTYTFSKMTGMKDKGAARLAAGNLTLTPGDLEVLAEGDEDGQAAKKAGAAEGSSRRSNSLRRQRTAAQPTPEAVDSPPPVPPIPPSTFEQPPPPPSASTDAASPAQTVPSPASPAGPISVFLQVGRQVKKVTIEPGLSFSSLRILFIDRFSYNPGQDNFPEIYIRDPASGVQYELEDISEVKNKCLLSLNIEPLDQIKQHIDLQIGSLSQELKDLKTSLNTARRLSMPPPAMSTPAVPSPSTTSSRPSEEQLQRFARRMSRMPADGGSATSTPAAQPLVPQVTGGTLSEEQSSRIVNDLRTHFDEVGNLRRDLGVLRQLYTDFMSSTKESLGTLRSQATAVKKLADSKVGGARGYIDSGKATLDSRSQTVLTKVEELQDTIEGLKDDVLKRHVTPKLLVMKKLKVDIEDSAAELESLKQTIQTVKPMWKKTWEEELQNIVEEQQFLSHQEEFLSDLIEDHKAVSEVYGHVEKVISLRGSQSGRSGGGARAFRPPPPPEQGAGGFSTVMFELRGAAVDPEKRMRAIEANQRARTKELEARSDEFQDELHSFVKDRKLKMTGGAEEVERVRQKRQEATLRAMFNGGTGSPSSPPP